ncbi:MAG: glycosyltransferase family 2 protein [Actinomycetota bacterium]
MDDSTTTPTPRSGGADGPAPGASGAGATTGTTTTGYPLVTVAMVAHNPGAWFEEVLASIVAQDYPSLEVVVIDAASDTPVAPRVHEAIPEAMVIPLLANQGFAKNANIILDHPSLGPYLLVLHDDVALAPDCIRRLVEETLRSNAGVIGPKLLDWNDPNRILHVGLGADKTGLVSDLAEPGEYDQEQHDAVRDVFAVPGAATLLRTDLFRALGGFDEQMVVRGEDLDLCWRAHALGARVLVNPAATARHREDLTTRIPGSDYDRFARRHRIRSMLSNYGFLHTLRVVPQALGAALVNIIIALFQGRIGAIFEILGAWLWNLQRLPSILRRRRQLRRIRQVDDSEVRALQIPGFEGINAWRQARADRREEIEGADNIALGVQRARRTRELQATAAVWFGVIAVLVFGSRGLISEGVPRFNQFTGFPRGPSSLLTEWGSTWRPTGLGAEAPSSLLHVLLGFAGIALFGQMGLLRLLVTVGLLGVGAFGAYRLLAPFKAVQAQLVALVVYVIVPLPYNALYEGSWSGLVAYASLPWIARRLASAASIDPFADDDPTLTRRFADVVALGLILALAALVEPAVVVAPALFAVAWLVGSLATRRVGGSARAIVAAALGTVVAIGLSLPASAGLFSADTVWSTLAGAAPVDGDGIGLTRLFRLATGPHGDTPLGWIVLIVPALALVMASGPRLAWAARSWFLIVFSVGLAFAVEEGAFSVSMPPAVVLLAPAALGIAMAAGMTAVAFGSDLRRYGFGWRQLVPFVAVGALGLSSVAGIGAVVDGRWQVVEDGYDDVIEFFDERAPAHGRTLWLGEASVLPVRGWTYDDRLSWSLTPARTPTILDHAIGNPGDATLAVRDTFAAELEGAGNRLGRSLAFFGVRYVVVVESNAPEPFGSIDRPVDPMLASRLTEQLDLIRIEVRSGATIYENRAYVPLVSAFAPGTLVADAPGAVAYELALPEVTSLRSYRGSLGAGDIWFGAPADTNWQLEVNGAPVAKGSQEWASRFDVAAPGTARLVHANESTHWVASVVQLISWAAIVVLLVLGRRRRS